MAKYIGYKKPRNTKRTLLRLISYMGRHKFSMFVVGLLVIVSSLASVFGTYMLKPIINQYIIPKDIPWGSCMRWEHRPRWGITG